MKASELKPGDEFWHRSTLKIPNPLTVGSITTTPKNVVIIPAAPYSDYQFKFPLDQKMNPHLHPPKIKSVAMDQLPTPRTDADAHVFHKKRWAVSADFARTLERELLASQARERVLRSALVEMHDTCLQLGAGIGHGVYERAKAALNHP